MSCPVLFAVPYRTRSATVLRGSGASVVAPTGKRVRRRSRHTGLAAPPAGVRRGRPGAGVPVEDERLDGDVGLDVVGAQERAHLSAGYLLDPGYELGAHGLLERE